MSQHIFAARFGFSVNTLRHWEQGNREPEGPARAYLLVIARAPGAVRRRSASQNGEKPSHYQKQRLDLWWAVKRPRYRAGCSRG